MEDYIILIAYEDENEYYEYEDECMAEGHYAELEQMTTDDLISNGIIGFAYIALIDKQYKLIEHETVSIINIDVVNSTINSYIENLNEEI